MGFVAQPTLVQHLSTGLDTATIVASQGIQRFILPLAHPVLAGNTIIIGAQSSTNYPITSVVDDAGNVYVTGPTSTNATTGDIVAGFYCLHALPGARVVTITTSAAVSQAFFSAEISEFAGVGALNGVAVAQSTDSTSPYTAGSAITTTADGCLLWTAGFSFGGGSGTLTAITAGSGMTLLSADIRAHDATMAQYGIQAAAGAVTPDFVTSGNTTDTFGMLAFAFAPSRTGTLPDPGSLRVRHLKHQFLGTAGSGTAFQFPSQGNLIVGLYTSASQSVSTITDGASNTWVSGVTTNNTGTNVSQVLYVQNAVTSPTLAITAITYSGSPTGDQFLVLYDIENAPVAAAGGVASASGTQSVTADLTTVTITPQRLGSLVFGTVSVFSHDCIGLVLNGSLNNGQLFDSCVNTWLDDGPNSGDSPFDEDNGYARQATTTLDPITFTYRITATGAPTGTGKWSACAMEFFGPPPGTSGKPRPVVTRPATFRPGLAR